MNCVLLLFLECDFYHNNFQRLLLFLFYPQHNWGEESYLNERGFIQLLCKVT